VKWDDKIFAPINNTKLPLACAVCHHKIASENKVTQVQKLENTGDAYTLAELSNTVACSYYLVTS
jgi:cytochrome c553